MDSETIQSWIERRRAVRAEAVAGPWEFISHDPSNGPHRSYGVDSPFGAVVFELPWWPNDMGEGNARAIVDDHEQMPRALSMVEAVLELHEPFEWSFGFGPVKSCRECVRLGASEEDSAYPCATVRAIETPVNDPSLSAGDQNQH